MIQLHSGSVMLQGGVPVPIPAAGSEASKNTVSSNDELGRKTG